MNATAKFAIAGSTGYATRLRPHSRVEKVSASNAPYGERRGDDVQTVTLTTSQPRARLCQIETGGYEPDWNGPRLTAPFVAQVLGQVLTPDSETKVSALSAYRGESKVFRALLCDRRV